MSNPNVDAKLLLIPVIRQYRRITGRGDLVIGYDRVETEELIQGLLDAADLLRHINTQQLAAMTEMNVLLNEHLEAEGGTPTEHMYHRSDD